MGRLFAGSGATGTSKKLYYSGAGVYADEQQIGLFPLELVLFPGSSLPLHIFEARYKQLINTVLDTGGVFGLNFIQSSRVYPVGCTAEVSNVLRRLPDGLMDIEITGLRRYRLTKLMESAEPYYVGRVEYFGDVAEERNTMLQQECIEVFNTMAEMVYANYKQVCIDPTQPPEQLSFRIAEKSGLDVRKKQEVLEMQSESRRLEYLLAFIRSYLPDLRKQWKIAEIVRNDGYLPRR